MRNTNFLLLLLICGMSLITLVACGNENVATESKVDNFSSNAEEDLNVKSTEELLANEKNTADNGFIIINDENDFPDFVENLRYCEKKTDNVYSICTFDGTVVFELETTIIV